jgi:hypothetical protein
LFSVLLFTHKKFPPFSMHGFFFATYIYVYIYIYMFLLEHDVLSFFLGFGISFLCEECDM